MSSSAEFTVSACPVDYAYVSNLQSRTVRRVYFSIRTFRILWLPYCFHEAKEMKGEGRERKNKQIKYLQLLENTRVPKQDAMQLK